MIRELEVDIYPDQTIGITFYQYDKYYYFKGHTTTTTITYEQPTSAFNGDVQYTEYEYEAKEVHDIEMVFCVDELTQVFELEPDHIDMEELINQINKQL